MPKKYQPTAFDLIAVSYILAAASTPWPGPGSCLAARQTVQNSCQVTFSGLVVVTQNTMTLIPH